MSGKNAFKMKMPLLSSSINETDFFARGTSMYYVSTKGGGMGSAKCLRLLTGGGARGHTYVIIIKNAE